MSHKSVKVKRPDPLSKKVPENPKFKHVRSTIDTEQLKKESCLPLVYSLKSAFSPVGASITKHLEKLEELKRDYKYRRDEIFKRMKVTTFVQLIIQVADFESHSGHQSVNGTGDPRTSFRPDTTDLEVKKIQRENMIGGSDSCAVDTPIPETSRSRLEEVIKGVGEADLNSEYDRRPVVSGSNCPYLLLDVRDKDAYDGCHIITAESYPTAMLARSVNYESKQMLQYKNKEGQIIILYDNDETLAHRAATTLVQRGYDNLFMLSGGLRVAAKAFPEGLITGTVPWSVFEGSGSKGKPFSHTPTVQKAADKRDFTQDDLNRLMFCMDSALSDHSTSNRLSQGSKGRASSLSSVTSSTVMARGGRPPFKP